MFWVTSHSMKCFGASFLNGPIRWLLQLGRDNLIGRFMLDWNMCKTLASNRNEHYYLRCVCVYVRQRWNIICCFYSALIRRVVVTVFDFINGIYRLSWYYYEILKYVRPVCPVLVLDGRSCLTYNMVYVYYGIMLDSFGWNGIMSVVKSWMQRLPYLQNGKVISHCGKTSEIMQLVFL